MCMADGSPQADKWQSVHPLNCLKDVGYQMWQEQAHWLPDAPPHSSLGKCWMMVVPGLIHRGKDTYYVKHSVLANYTQKKLNHRI